ncbi:MAG TPA: hypothetical protein VGD99_02320 [Anaerolineae bacterium]
MDSPIRNPYYWGLNLRWLGSALIGLVELWLYTLSARQLREVWGSYASPAGAPSVINSHSCWCNFVAMLLQIMDMSF